MAREIDVERTVGEIAKDFPELIPELERLGIDYCCGGSRTLGDAAARIGEEPRTVADALIKFEASGSDDLGMSDVAHLSMTELADHIEQTHHAVAREMLERLGVMIAKCVEVHANREPRFVELQSLVATLTVDMHDHFVREERVLFPWLRRLERPTEIQGGPPWSVKRPIDCMIHDHDEVGEAFSRIRRLTDDLTAPAGACETWRGCYRLLGELEHDTHLHVHKENNILFPAGIEAEKRRGELAVGGAAHSRRG